LRLELAGREAVLTFEDEKGSQPILIGLVQPPLNQGEQVALEDVELFVDKRRVVLTAREEISFRCGSSSITLTRAGKVLIRGAYVLTRSSGVNRIKGGSVQIN
jgi:hypothetical protein